MLPDPSSVSVSREQVAARELTSVVLNCSGFGVPPPMLSWARRDGREVEGRIVQRSVRGGDGRERKVLELHLENITSSDGGDLTCSGRNNVTNLISAPEEATVTLIVLGE